uniref:TIM barrel protein n=1 Tax=Roseihalotalea indica TaxID=2867963 RepID=A0AA49GKN6_9BACT|nr:TIM barrel protein [Tunicatimonas sp. TK19036]
MKTSRRSALKHLAGSAALISTSSMAQGMSIPSNKTVKLKGNVKHSVCKWCYNDIPLEEFCVSAKKMGIESVELLGPDEWPILKKHGLTCALAAYWENGYGISKCWNRKEHHNELVQLYEKSIPWTAEAGLKQIITFSGNRDGMDDETGMKNCAEGLKRIMPLAEKHNVLVVMELLNSKVNHPDYMCDHTEWGVELCKMIGSDNFKLLYDIYHMQIMEGDVIATIKKHHQYISHYHTGGVPGRAEIDETQELYYPAIMRAILETGFDGYVAQEFVPKDNDVLASLQEGVEICDV